MAIGRLPLQFHLFDQEDTLSERVCGAVKSLCSLHVDNPMIELIICSEPIQDVGQFGGEMRSAHGRRMVGDPLCTRSKEPAFVTLFPWPVSKHQQVV